jgi:UDP-N-acetylmuramoyl-tripeptide--D-alanyl-D-alanine ligase
MADESADYIILVGKKNGELILKGIKNNKNVYIANDLNDALNKMNEIKTNKSVILFENDLPDNYL